MSKIVLLGEAYGAQEEQEGRPFVGPSGYILDQMLAQAGIARRDCYATNVLNLRPRPSNDIVNCCGPKAESVPGTPMLTKGKYLRKEFAGELERLYTELDREKPMLVIALGATAAWALLGTSGIKSIRGAPALGRGGVKVLPTYHPAAVMRDWTLRPIVISDFDKAKREAEFPELRRPQRFIYIEPTLADLSAFEDEFIRPARTLSIDIETKLDQITCVGFAPSAECALVVPFYDPMQTDGNYWRTIGEEMLAWDFVRRQCISPKLKVGQNFLYDMHFLWKQYGIPMVNTEDDTMLLHHALQPEMEKGLGFLGSIYTDEQQWKFMRKKHETLKKED